MTDASDAPTRRRGGWLFWKLVISIFLYLATFAALAAVGMAVALFLVYEHVTQPGHPGAPIEVTVPEGLTGREVGELLVGEGLLGHESFFRLALRLDKSGTPIKHGIYELPKGASASELLAALQAGPDRQENLNQHRVTIPEGLAIGQMQSLFEDQEAFLEAASRPALIERLGIDADTLEGFLMPNTYFFDAPPTPSEVVERMVEQFEQEYAVLLEEIPEAANYDKLAIVTAASLIEEEARVPDERPLVAAVIYNRIDRGMPLQMDATLAYIAGKFGERILDADKEIDSPYNTYKYSGLPPGPISSPGVDSIRAALKPASVDYFYFVSNADGLTHTFSSTDREHQQAVARYRREIAEQRRAQQ
jgi:UPF0755 protein